MAQRGTFFHGPKSATSSHAGGGKSTNSRADAMKSSRLAKKNAAKKGRSGGSGGQRRDGKGRFA